MSLNASDTPDLIAEEPPSTNSPGHTLFRKIDLEIDPMGGKPAKPMTAVFAPEPKQLATGHGDVLSGSTGTRMSGAGTAKVICTSGARRSGITCESMSASSASLSSKTPRGNSCWWCRH